MAQSFIALLYQWKSTLLEMGFIGSVRPWRWIEPTGGGGVSKWVRTPRIPGGQLVVFLWEYWIWQPRSRVLSASKSNLLRRQAERQTNCQVLELRRQSLAYADWAFYEVYLSVKTTRGAPDSNFVQWAAYGLSKTNCLPSLFDGSNISASEHPKGSWLNFFTKIHWTSPFPNEIYFPTVKYLQRPYVARISKAICKGLASPEVAWVL